MTHISEEYANALFVLAAEENVKRDVADSVNTLKSLFLEYPEYIDLLASPNVPFDDRAGLIDRALGEGLHEYAVSFVKLLCERGHIREIIECADEFLKLYEASDGVVTAYVTSAAPLDEAQRTELQKKLENKLMRKVELVCEIDTSILGGVIVKADGSVMDGSLKTKLSELGNLIGN